MIIYNSFLIILLILNFNKKCSVRKLTYYFSFFILVIVNIFRHKSIGSDTGTYLNMYKLINYKVKNDLYIEDGYFYYNKILNYLSTNEIFLLIVSGIIIFYAFYKFIKFNSVNIFMSLYFFIGLRYYGSTMNLLRQMIAISIILIIFNKIEKYEKKRLIGLNLLAMLFHKSAIVFLIIIFLKKVRYSRKYYIKLNILSVIIFLFSNKLLILITKINYFSRYKNYFGGESFTSWNFGNITQVIISFIITFFYYKFFIKNRKKITIKNSVYGWICSFGLLFSVSSIFGSLLARLALYFTIFNIVIIPMLLKKYNNKVVSMCVILFVFLYHYFTMKLRPEWNFIYPYKFYWN